MGKRKGRRSKAKGREKGRRKAPRPGGGARQSPGEGGTAGPVGGGRQGDGTDASRAEVVALAVEWWRFRRVLEGLLRNLDAGRERRYRGSLEWFSGVVARLLEAEGLRVVDLTGRPYEPGFPVSALNIDEFAEDDELVVEAMLVPILMGPGGVAHPGTVMLRRVDR